MNLMDFFNLDDTDQKEYCLAIEKENQDFQFIKLGRDEDKLPTFRHRNSQIDVKFIPSGKYLMGLSIEEENCFSKLAPEVELDTSCMRPVHEESVNSIFVSVYPILPSQYEYVSKSEYPDAKYEKGNPVSLTFEEADSFVNNIGARLPTEAEWEYCCRGGTQTLFYFGNALPAKEELEQYVSEEFQNNIAFKSNQFGLFGLFSGEWCSDDFVIDYDPKSDPERGMKVFRAEGSARWPWQYDIEWAYCISAFRSKAPKEKYFRAELFGKSGAVLIVREHPFRTVWTVS